MNIVFCVDRSVLPGLHVAAYSLLERFNTVAGRVRFELFSDALTETDAETLQRSLQPLEKEFAVRLHRVDASYFQGFPALNGSWATYYRLHAARSLEVERFLYVDADTLCDVDVSPLAQLDLQGAPAAWVPESPLNQAIDRQVAEELGNRADASYFNAGVMLVEVKPWQQQCVSERAMDYIAAKRPAFHDQSALNVVLHRQASVLNARFNCMSNMRKNWTALKHPYGQISRLVHFLDYPKPWDWLGEFLHPQYSLWRSVLDKTVLRGFRSWHNTPARRFPRTQKAWTGYRKAGKDRVFFGGYRRGWLSRVKGVTEI